MVFLLLLTVFLILKIILLILEILVKLTRFLKDIPEEIKQSKNEIKEIILFISKKYNLDEDKLLTIYQKAEKNITKEIYLLGVLYLIRKKSVSYKQLISLINKINFLN